MSDLREKVAQIVDPFALEVRTVDPKTGETLATEALLKADRIITVCMEEAASVIAQRQHLLNQQYEALDVGRENAVYDICAAALRALRGEGGMDG